MTEEGILRKGVRLANDDENVYIPITDEAEVEYPTVEMDLDEFDIPSGYRELLNLDPPLQELLPTSFDVIGDVYIVKLEDDLLPHADKIGKAVLDAHKNAEVVALDKGVQGEFRTRDLEVIAGEKRTTTTHREYDLRFEMDLAKVYFSPRLATERKRISDIVRESERVIDMFAGVGPFSIMIAKFSKPGNVYAIDKNPDAINYLINNIKINRINKVAPMLGDARDVISALKSADRIIMNLPHSAIDFLDVGLSAVKPGGCIHLYSIVEKDALGEVDLLIRSMTEKNGKKVASINVHEVHTYSPSSCLYCFDIIIE